MKLGFVSAILPEESLEDIFEFAAECGYSCVELMCWPVGKAERKYAGVTHVDVVDFNEEKAKQVNALADQYQVEISGLGFYPNILSDDEEYAESCVEHLKKVMDAAGLLGLNNVNTFIGAEHTRSVDENFKKFEKVWPGIVKYAEEQGLLLGIENCPMLFTMDEWPSGKNLAYSPAIWRRMFEAIPSPNFGLNYDPSHMVWQMMDYVVPLYEFADRIFHAHAKDLKVEEHKLMDGGVLSLGWSTPKIPGLGDIDWGRFFSGLTDVGYDGPVCVEVEDDAYAPELEKRKNALRVSKKVLDPYFP